MQGNAGASSPAGRIWDDSPWVELRIALVVFATVAGWVFLASWVGTGPSLTIFVLTASTIAAVHWRRRLTPEVLTLVAWYGVPASVVALWWT